MTIEFTEQRLFGFRERQGIAQPGETRDLGDRTSLHIHTPNLIEYRDYYGGTHLYLRGDIDRQYLGRDKYNWKQDSPEEDAKWADVEARLTDSEKIGHTFLAYIGTRVEGVDNDLVDNGGRVEREIVSEPDYLTAMALGMSWDNSGNLFSLITPSTERAIVYTTDQVWTPVIVSDGKKKNVGKGSELTIEVLEGKYKGQSVEIDEDNIRQLPDNNQPTERTKIQQ